VPIDRQDAFALAERPIVANWQAVRYDEVADWFDRVRRLTGGEKVFANRPVDLTELRAAFDDLTPDQMRAIARRYDAPCLVATTRYPFPQLHRSGTVRIYRVPTTAAP
jgi:hypothetical protein